MCERGGNTGTWNVVDRAVMEMLSILQRKWREDQRRRTAVGIGFIYRQGLYRVVRKVVSILGYHQPESPDRNMTGWDGNIGVGRTFIIGVFHCWSVLGPLPRRGLDLQYRQKATELQVSGTDFGRTSTAVGVGQIHR